MLLWTAATRSFFFVRLILASSGDREHARVGAYRGLADTDAEAGAVGHNDMAGAVGDAVFQHVLGEHVMRHVELAAERDAGCRRDQLRAGGKPDAALPERATIAGQAGGVGDG